MPLESIEAEALKLSPEERSLLAERQVESLTPDLTYEAEWSVGIHRRVAAIESGEDRSVPAEEVLAEVRRILV